MKGAEQLQLDNDLALVRREMLNSLSTEPLRAILTSRNPFFNHGKMLRSRLALRVGPAVGVSRVTLIRAATTIEMIHLASLLHDDVIDEGQVRRGAPAFWVEHGVSGAILTGDLLMLKALDLMSKTENGRFLTLLIRMSGEVCAAESEQELLLRGQSGNWEKCVDIARRKTGPFFAFLGHVSGGREAALREALQEAGYLIGTAYQLADDLLDIRDSFTQTDKTLGRDSARAKLTAASAFLDAPTDPVSCIEELCQTASQLVAPWPNIRKAWDQYVTEDIQPVLSVNLGSEQPP